MRFFGALSIALLLLGSAGLRGADAQVRTTVIVDRDGLRHFHLAVGDHYGHPYSSVARIQARSIHPDEVPVVFFIAREARVSPDAVVALRARGWSWWDVSMNLGVRKRAFAALLPRRVGPPHGHAHGYWARRDARTIRYLSDRQIVDWVNLHFLVTHYRVAPERVIGLREHGRSYAQVETVVSGRTPAPSRAVPAQARSARPPLRGGRGPGVTMKEDPRGARGAPGRGRGAGRP